MVDFVIHDIPDEVLDALSDQAQAEGISLSLEGIGTEEGVVFVCGTDELAAFHSPKNHGVYPRKWIVLNSAFGERSGHGDVLSAKTVGIVGVGSVGSKLAEMGRERHDLCFRIGVSPI